MRFAVAGGHRRQQAEPERKPDCTLREAVLEQNWTSSRSMGLPCLVPNWDEHSNSSISIPRVWLKGLPAKRRARQDRAAAQTNAAGEIGLGDAAPRGTSRARVPPERLPEVPPSRPSKSIPPSRCERGNPDRRFNQIDDGLRPNPDEDNPGSRAGQSTKARSAANRADVRGARIPPTRRFPRPAD